MATSYDPAGIIAFYDAYGALEWERLQTAPYGRVEAVLHADLIEEHVEPGMSVLDAGCGPGRFCTELDQRSGRRSSTWSGGSAASPASTTQAAIS